MYSWYKITLQAVACAFIVEHSINEVYLPADFSILLAQILEIIQLTLYRYNKENQIMSIIRLYIMETTFTIHVAPPLDHYDWYAHEAVLLTQVTDHAYD